MPLFLFIFIFYNTLLLHGCCRLEATGRRVEAGLQCERCGYTWNVKVKVSRGITQCPHRDSNLCPAHQGIGSSPGMYGSAIFAVFLDLWVCNMRNFC
jgi:hypothetical protein